ncbi:hypothetical protein [Sagittula sp. SSi028]|uniref:hypothetical protein n=1 Tax=Sagittula sp. SSi028 TaxID=3400636 RepID=UPI003AF7B448
MFKRVLTASIVSAVCMASMGGAQTQDGTEFDMAAITSDGRIHFGLGLDGEATPILIDMPEVVAYSGSGRAPFVSSRAGGPDAQLRHLIAYAEAGMAGYDAVQLGARRLPPKLPTQMTVQEIFQWIYATPGQPHAIGRYQFIPSTLRSLLSRAGVAPTELFSPQLQDHLANILLDDAGYGALMAGKISRERFMYNLAGIWAGLPLPSGKSRYHNYAGNRATISWQTFDAEMTRIFAAR